MYSRPLPLEKNRRRGVCDSPLLSVYGDHVIFPGMCGKWFDWLLLEDLVENYTHVNTQVAPSDPGTSEKTKETKIFKQSFLAII